MKYFLIFALLLGIISFASANENDEKISQNNVLGDVVIIVKIKGEFIGWNTGGGQITIFCDPPYIPDCYTLIYSTPDYSPKSVIPNDGKGTEIGIIGEPVITTDGVTGRETHTFVKQL